MKIIVELLIAIIFLQDPKKPSGSALNDLVDLNFGAVSPNPPQRTAASLDPWSPLGRVVSIIDLELIH